MPGSKPGSLPLADPRSSSLRVPCGSRTGHRPKVGRASLEGWHLCRLGQGHSRRKERESNPQGSSLGRDHASHGARRLPSRAPPRSGGPACPSVLSTGCGGRNRTCDMTLNRRPPVPTQAPPQSKSGRRDLNPRSRAPGARGIPGFPTSCTEKRPAGVEPALLPWQGSRLPRPSLRDGAPWRVVVCRIVKQQESNGRDSNPRRRITGAVSSPRPTLRGARTSAHISGTRGT